MKEAKILIIGFGSIGKRHFNNLLMLEYKNISIVSRHSNEKDKYDNIIQRYNNIDDAFKDYNYDIAIISTETSEHIKILEKILKYNVKNIYLEKPISHEYKEYQDIITIINRKKINIIVGYDLHFELGLLKVKELLEKNSIGNVISFIAEVGQYLPDWRPGVDYRNTMSSKVKDGGGVMLDLIHEVDYLNWLIGPFSKVANINDQVSELEIDTEDVAVFILKSKDGIIGSLHLDYLQKDLCRKCKFIGNSGTIIWDYVKREVKWKTHSCTSWSNFDYSFQERNDRFIDIMKAFLNSTKKIEDNRLCSFEEALISLKIVHNSKESNLNNRIIKL
ncbi:Gfo/Idh/MocA family oxidoreductase [Malaciobacter mytili]|uniref:Gfo/Idh/MocA family protein n=1 Tax=Malaciobacter mytili TaxID=603050 RepID=UPI003BB1DBBA